VEIFPSRVLVLAASYVIQELSGCQSLQASTSVGQKIQHLSQPTCWIDLVVVGHEISRWPANAFFASRPSPSLSFAANVQVTTSTLLPLQHSHLEPSFSTVSNLPCPLCKQLTCIAATLTIGSFSFTHFLNMSLPLKMVPYTSYTV
jgi:hypothetical protein